jgi:alkylhydroperoxidase/carboxymuconolactone decarboxylase family protein YurZ
MVNKEYISKCLIPAARDSRYRKIRLLSILSAAIAHSKPETTRMIMDYLKQKRIRAKSIWEIILQSHLVTGFPRMIEAAIIYNEVIGNGDGRRPNSIYNHYKESAYYKIGERLCRKIYGKNFIRLKNRFNSIAPEIFEWIIAEAYGKVLSRPGLKTIERELAMTAILIVDNQKRQLISHIMGSHNAGADFDLIRRINRDILPFAGKSRCQLAERLIDEIENKYAAAK